MTRRILCVPADYSTPFLTLAMKRGGLIAIAKRLSRRYNAMLKCRVFKAFQDGLTIVRCVHPGRPLPGTAKSVQTAAFCHFFN